jgi:hypothetical protein
LTTFALQGFHWVYWACIAADKVFIHGDSPSILEMANRASFEAVFVLGEKETPTRGR